MSVIQSKLNTRSEEFTANSAQMQTLVDDLGLRIEEMKKVAVRNTSNGMNHAENCWCATASMP